MKVYLDQTSPGFEDAIYVVECESVLVRFEYYKESEYSEEKLYGLAVVTFGSGSSRVFLRKDQNGDSKSIYQNIANLLLTRRQEELFLPNGFFYPEIQLPGVPYYYKK